MFSTIGKRLFPHHDAATAGARTPLPAYLYGALLSLIALAARYATRGPVYMVDGPRLVAAIVQKTYVIQPPGYWLFAHLGGIFPDPAFGLSFWNQAFSSFGVGVIFLICVKLRLPSFVSWLAALAYGSTFFLWFAGDTHSSYAGEALFAPLLFYSCLSYKERPSVSRLIYCSLAFSAGAGIRPSDGAFLLPFCLFFALRWVSDYRHRAVLLVATAVFCLSWYLPTQAALRMAHNITYDAQLDNAIGDRSLLLSGVNKDSVLNVARVVIASAFAFWMFLPLLLVKTNAELRPALLLWAVPGLAVFMLIYMADADYMTFCVGAFVLAAAVADDSRFASLMLLTCFCWNTALFLFARPFGGSSIPGQLVNFYVVKYCHYGIVHQWTSTLGQRGSTP